MFAHRGFLSLAAVLCLQLWAGSECLAAVVLPSPPEDLASQANGGVALSSSVYGGAVAALGNDGNRDGYYWNGSVMHTSNEEYAWLQVTLAHPVRIQSVWLFNRTDGAIERINPFMLQVFNGASEVYNSGSLSFTQDIYIPPIDTSSASGDVLSVPAVFGNRVRITQLRPGSTEYMNLAELEVYEIPEPSALAMLLGLGGLGLAGCVWRSRCYRHR